MVSAFYFIQTTPKSFDGKIADSALAEHDHTCNGAINWDDIKILSREDRYYRRCIKESLEIRKKNTTWILEWFESG